MQQACEKLIKIQIDQSGIPYDNAQVFSHNLRNLFRYANALGIAICIPGEIERHLEMITRWEAGSRYDMHFSIRITTLKKYHKMIDEWYQIIREKRHSHCRRR